MAASEREGIIISSLLKRVQNIEKRLESDVDKVCCLLELIMTHLCEKGLITQGKNRSLASKIHRNLSDICMSMKLHLAFHLGEESALNHEKLKTFAHNILELPDEPEINTLPEPSHAIDPGSKVLEIVSMQQVLNSICGWM